MINEAEKYKEEDDKQRRKINAKNASENYVFQMKSTINEVNLKEKLSESEKRYDFQKMRGSFKMVR